MKIAIGSPLYIRNDHHFKDLCDAVASIKSSHELIWIPVGNFIDQQYQGRELPFTQKVEALPLYGRQPQAVSKAWNDIMQKAKDIDCVYTILINQDVVLHPTAIDKLIEYAQHTQPEVVLWSMRSGHLEETLPIEDAFGGPHFSAFMVRSDFIDQIGYFDENFAPAYYEDNDMHARIVLSGKKAVCYAGSIFQHKSSQTANHDPIARALVYATSGANDGYFRRKWGHTVVHTEEDMRTSYNKHPFKDAAQDINYWKICT